MAHIPTPEGLPGIRGLFHSGRDRLEKNHQTAIYGRLLH